VKTYPDALGEHTALRYRAGQACGRWEASQLQAGQALQKPEPLFRKLDEGILEEEMKRLGS
jgi:methionyl-tRNA synthetase